jgi:ribosomal protein S18 acetylase RimI-like enzyme
MTGRLMMAEPRTSDDGPLDALLFDRQLQTLVSTWGAYAAGSPGAAVHRTSGLTVAVFPHGPERAVYNNALLEPQSGRGDVHEAVRAVERRYAEAGVGRFAVWAHESDAAGVAALERAGLTYDTATRAMAMPLDDLTEPRPDGPFAPPDWRTYLRVIEVDEHLLHGVDQTRFPVRIALLDGRPVAAAMAFDHDGDCGIFNVGTRPEARRRGLGTAVTAMLLHDARARGCATASLQASPMAEHLYASLGFRDLGRWLEFVPAQPAG